MSHTILYDRLFVKMPDGTFTALVLSGDNNVTTINPRTGREIRDREWTSWSFGTPKPTYTEQEILDWLEREWRFALSSAENRLKFHPEIWNGGDATDEARRRFGFYAAIAVKKHDCPTTTYGMFRNFFLKGMKQAVTLEEFVAACRGFRAVHYDYRERPSGVPVRSAPLTTLLSIRENWPTGEDGESSCGWLVPVSPRAVERLAAEKAAAKGPRAVVVMHYRNADGTEKTAYVRSLLPFTLTEKPDEALAIPQKTIRRTRFFDLSAQAFPEYRFTEYEVHIL